MENLTLVSRPCARKDAQGLTAFEKLLSFPFREKTKTQRVLLPAKVTQQRLEKAGIN